MIQYIYDFLSILFDKVKDREKIRGIILFGSFARGDQRKDSDIDLFVDTNKSDKEEINELVKDSLNEFEIKVEKNWKLKGISNPIVPIVDDINAEKWSELRSEINSYGIVLYGKYKSSPEKIRQEVLIEYDISKIKQKDKMKIIRGLFGYQSKIGKKIYKQKGLLSDNNAEKLSQVIIVPLENYKKIYNFLKDNKVSIKLRQIWLKP